MPRLVAAGHMLLIVLVSSVACDAEGLQEGHSADPLVASAVVAEETLLIVDTVVAPDLSPRTEWFQRPHSLHVSSAPKHLWAIDRGSASLHEIGGDGTLVRSVGRKGEGPEELVGPLTMIDTGDLLLVLDPAARRIAAFTRDGGFHSEIPLDSRAWDIGVGDRSDRLLIVPGTDHLIDIYERAQQVGGAGPLRGDSIPCRSCEISMLADGRTVVADPATPRLFVFGRNLSAWTVIDLHNEVIAEWGGSRGRSMNSKDWISQIAGATESDVWLLMSGPAPATKGTEIWKVNATTGTIVRQPLSGKFVKSAVALGDTIYGLLGEFKATSAATGETLSEGAPAIVRFAVR